MENTKLFIITRSDLPPGARAAQSCHVAIAFAHEHPEVERAWFEGSNNIVLLEAKDEAALVILAERARALEVPLSSFREPDFDNAVTSVALASAGARLVSSLPLLLREPRPATSSLAAQGT